MIDRKTKEVPECDYELLKMIRISSANHDDVVIHGDLVLDKNGKEIKDPSALAKSDFKNAEKLRKFYNMTSQEVLEITGFWIG